MSALRIFYAAPILLIGAAAALYAVPVQQPAAPMSQQPAPETVNNTTFASLAASFDQNGLPERPAPQERAAPPPPPPDPGAALKSYRFIGLAVSNARAAGVFEKNGETLVLTPAAVLEGFSLTSVGAEAAHFEDENGTQVRLVLEKPARP